MELKEHIYSVLIVSSSEKFNKTITELLPKSRYEPIFIATDVGAANRLLLERSFDIVLINSPLTDDLGMKLAIDLCRSSGTGVLLFVKEEHYPDISSRVTPYGVLTVPKPTSTQLVRQSMLLLCATHERLRRLEKKTASVEEKMEEIRIVNRAKWLLIDNLKMSENDAHRYIEKQAMDRCVTRRSIAENIIQTYR